jgi:hypothetical protein
MSGIDPFGSVEEPPATTQASLMEPDTSTSKTTGKAKETAEPEEEKKPAGRKRSGLAMGGKPIDIEENRTSTPFPSWPTGLPDDQYVPQEEADYDDLSKINHDINRARAMSFRVKNRLAYARHHETEVGDKYRRAYNRQIISISGGTEAQRKAQAEINTEDIYSEFLVAQAVVKDLTNLSYAVSRDLDTLKTLSDNLRKQMSI